MLIRVLIKNFLSFNDAVEFNMLPNNKRKKHSEHIYTTNGINILKTAAIYGNNAAGKTNLIKALKLIVGLSRNKNITNNIYNSNVFKISNSSEVNDPILIAVEFFTNNKFFYYELKINSDNTINENLFTKKIADDDYNPLFKSSINNHNRLLNIFDDNGKKITNYIDDKIKSYINKNINSTIIYLQREFPITNNKNIEDAIIWLVKHLQIVDTDYILENIIDILYRNKSSFDFINKTIPELSLGVNSISISEQPISEALESNNDETKYLIDFLNKAPKELSTKISEMQNKTPIMSVIKEGAEIIVRQLNFTHLGINDSKVELSINNQSDGTKSSIIIMYILEKLINNNITIIIDELEKNMHPMIVKKLLELFLSESNAKGQLIFTTHETYLLDQELLRADEVWFTEKHQASTKLYSLNDFKQHANIDIQKGYLAGRYGAIPFLGNTNILDCD